jgi:hypothetical protein
MKEEENVFRVTDSNENFETWIEKDFVSNDTRNSLRQASILLIPTIGFRNNNEPTFPSGTEEFLAYFKEKLPDNLIIDICVDDDKYLELALHSDYKRIGKFLVRTVALSVFLNVFSSYIYDKVVKEEEGKPAIQIINNIDNSTHDTVIVNPSNAAPKKYLQPSKVKFTITVVDSSGVSKDFHYEGPAKDVKQVTDQIKEFWKNEN